MGRGCHGGVNELIITVQSGDKVFVLLEGRSKSNWEDQGRHTGKTNFLISRAAFKTFCKLHSFVSWNNNNNKSLEMITVLHVLVGVSRMQSPDFFLPDQISDLCA